ncbi:MAG: PH domain-containing protein [Bdellovibrionales bacterium]|nr:PH domain-containing protein [Bdellovibrionales bacterium]
MDNTLRKQDRKSNHFISGGLVPSDIDCNEVCIEVGSADQLSGQDRSVNLRATYPLAFRSIFANSWRSILALCGIFFLLRYGQLMALEHPVFSSSDIQPLLEIDVYYLAAYYVFYGALVLVSLKLIYEHLFHMTYYYGIEAEHFIITSGVLLKNRSSLHISLITDVFMSRNFIELLCGLFSVEAANPSPETPVSNRISSLSRKQAICLQDFIVNLVKETRDGLTSADERRPLSPAEKSSQRPQLTLVKKVEN